MNIADIQNINSQSRLKLVVTRAAFKLWCEMDHLETRLLMQICAKLDWDEFTEVMFDADQQTAIVENLDGRLIKLTNAAPVIPLKNAVLFENYMPTRVVRLGAR